ncbi:oxidoreductase [Candidatus Woesearchaeota archaeon]|nr:oxidoreductase [Candidatus Woesearchaeota archaeon]
MASYRAGVLEIVNETPRVNLFRLERPKGFSFVPGQFLMASIDGLYGREGALVKRSYSIASSPLDKDYLELCITRADNGLFSVAMHELDTGDVVNISGPYGVFSLKLPVPENATFIAGGSGIAPIRSMLRTLCSSPAPNAAPNGLRLFYGFRTPHEFIYRDELQGYAKKKKLVLHTTIDAPADNWGGDVGFVPEILPKYSDYAKSDAYICGPPVMVPAAIKVLSGLGFDGKRIYREQW